MKKHKTPSNQEHNMAHLVKQAFASDEALLANVFQLERLWKKYKYVLLAFVAVLVIWLGYRAIYNSMQENKANHISEIYKELVANPTNDVLLQQLQTLDPSLYDLYRLSQIERLTPNTKPLLQELAQSKNPLVKEIASYNLASLQQEFTQHDKDAFNDFARIQQAYLLLQDGQIPQARKELEGILPNSLLYSIAMRMKHYGIVKYPLEQDLVIKEIPATSASPTSINPTSTNPTSTAPSSINSTPKPTPTNPSNSSTTPTLNNPTSMAPIIPHSTHANLQRYTTQIKATLSAYIPSISSMDDASQHKAHA